MGYHNPQGQLGSTSMYKSQEIHQQPGYLFFHGSFGGSRPEKKTRPLTRPFNNGNEPSGGARGRPNHRASSPCDNHPVD